MSEVQTESNGNESPESAKKRGGRKPGQPARKLDEVDVMMRARKLIETLDSPSRSLVASYINSKFGVHHA